MLSHIQCCGFYHAACSGPATHDALPDRSPPVVVPLIPLSLAYWYAYHGSQGYSPYLHQGSDGWPVVPTPSQKNGARSIGWGEGMNGHAVRSVGSRFMAGILLLCLAWLIVVRYAEHGQPVQRDLQLSFQTRADCLRALTTFREALLTSFTQQSFAGMFTLTGTVVSVWRNPDLTGIRQWLPWNYQAVWVKSACQET